MRIDFAAVWGRAHLVAFLCAAAGVLLLVGADRADAAKGVAALIGQEGTGPGQFTFPSGVAINDASGDVYVVDAACCGSGGQRVLQFSSDGSFTRAWGWGVATGSDAFEICTTVCREGIAGSGDGQFSLEYGAFSQASPQIAIDQSDGSVYVADNLNDRVQKFTASGAYVGQFGGSGSGDGQLSMPQGVAVAPDSGDVYVADFNNNRVQRFDSGGTYLSQFGTAGSGDGEFLGPYRLAVDSIGRVYVIERDNPRVQRFAQTGAFDQAFASASVGGATDIAVDPTEDHVYIAGRSPDFTSTGIFEFDAEGNGIDVHAVDTNLDAFPAGLAVRATGGAIYASSPLAPKAVLAIDEVIPPTVVIGAVEGVTATGATFNGTVNPQGPPTASYRFEYSSDGLNWLSVPPEPGAEIGAGTADVPVSQTAFGLAPNTEYRVRLVASKPFNAARVASTEATFATAPAPPLVRPLAAGSRTATAAWLGAAVNPRNSQTGFYVEYTQAADTAYEDSSRVPVPPNTADAGSGDEYIAVRQLVTDLAPGTEYRFRVVAANQAGTTEGADGTFVTAAAAPTPPGGRNYEMVSPLDKNGSDADRNLPSDVVSTSGAAASGNAVAYAAQGQFAGIGSGTPQGQYLSVRGPTGWTTRGITPPIEDSPSSDVLVPQMFFLSEEVSKAVVATNVLLTPEASLLGGSWGLYLQDNAGSASSYRLLSVPWAPLPPEPPLDPAVTGRAHFDFAGASSDMRHIVFEANDRPLTSDGPAVGRGIYEWADGEVRFVSELPSGAPANEPNAGSGKGNAIGQDYPGDHIVSDDGQRLFFADRYGPGSEKALYVREQGIATRLVSASERTGDDPSEDRPGTFQAAMAADGSRVLLTSNVPLTDEATATGVLCQGDTPVSQCHSDLYLWNADAPSGARLTDLTTEDPGGGGVTGVAAATEDLSHTYFVAGGALAEGAIPGRPNLYLWSAASGGLRHVATLDEADVPVWNTERDHPTRRYRDARVSADGKRFLFASRARLTATDNDGHKQVYLYDAETERLVCVSCREDGMASDGDSWFFYPLDLGPTPTTPSPRMPYRLPRNLSADGERAFFETAQGLVPEDANGKADVYIWEQGELSLVSTGRGDEESEFVDASVSGNDVFFTTRERLVATDSDNQVDVYDARVGGSLPPPPPPPPCVGDGCRPPLSPRPVLPEPGSTVESGNPPLPTRAAFAARRLPASARRALVGGRRATLVVRVNRTGRVTVRATARVGDRVRTVMTASKRARKAGRVGISLRLSQPARRQLMRSGKLRVSLTVRFSGSLEPVTMSLTLSKSGRNR